MYLYLSLKNNIQPKGKKMVYFIPDNGGRPFKVVIENNKNVHIYKQKG